MFKVKIFVLLSVFWFYTGETKAQSDAPFEQQEIASVHILVAPDTVAWLYANVTSNRYFRATVIYQNSAFSDTIYQVGFRLRGNTSRYAQKKSFKLSFNTFQSGRRYRGVKKFNLLGQHNDPTMVREKLYYDIWNKLGLPERRTSFVKVYINETYYGLYTNAEEMDNDWLKRLYGNNNGNLYKCTYPADLVYLGDDQNTYKSLTNGTVTGGRVYELETNTTADNYIGLVNFIKTIHEATGGDAEQKINSVLNTDLWLKVLALDVATGNWDNYSYNKNNFFLHHNPLTGKFEFISYDTDNTFGVDWVQIDWAKRAISNWIHPSEPRPLASRVLAVPAFRERYYLYLDSITRHVLHPFHIYPSIDAMQAFVRPAVEADSWRTLDYGYTLQSYDLGFTGTVGGHVPYGIKPFLAQRASHTLQQLQTVNLQQATSQLQSPQLQLRDGLLTISGMPVEKSAELLLIDNLGRVVLCQNLQTNQSVPLKRARGVYHYHLFIDGKIYTGRLLR
jgi:hypothetical protein